MRLDEHFQDLIYYQGATHNGRKGNGRYLLRLCFIIFTSLFDVNIVNVSAQSSRTHHTRNTRDQHGKRFSKLEYKSHTLHREISLLSLGLEPRTFGT